MVTIYNIGLILKKNIAQLCPLHNLFQHTEASRKTGWSGRNLTLKPSRKANSADFSVARTQHQSLEA